MPLNAADVTNRPFDVDELLYRRIQREELNSKGEVDPTRINGISFNTEVRSAPSVNRGAFSSPEDVINSLCADGKDVSSWLVFYIRVDQLPLGLVSGDGRSFDFIPVHHPLETCGAHSVVACTISSDLNRTYVKPSRAVINDFKVKFATSLQSIRQIFDLVTHNPLIENN